MSEQNNSGTLGIFRVSADRQRFEVSDMDGNKLVGPVNGNAQVISPDGKLACEIPMPHETPMSRALNDMGLNSDGMPMKAISQEERARFSQEADSLERSMRAAFNDPEKRIKQLQATTVGVAIEVGPGKIQSICNNTKYRGR